MRMHHAKLTLSILLVAIGLQWGIAPAQFSSGSTGADNALDIQSNTTIPVPANGVFNYTTINVATGFTLKFDNSTNNVPVILLATGDVTIAGTIDVSGENGRGYDDPLAGMAGSEAKPGSGGYHGGIGGISPANSGDPDSAIGTSGGGPGGGAAANDNTPNSSTTRGRVGNGGSHFTAGAADPNNPNPASPTYGDLRLITLSGGSGGAGGNINTGASPTTHDGPGGGAGGGAILVASSTSITVNGVITAKGGNGHFAAGLVGGGVDGSGGGAGGAIRLMANSIGGTGSCNAQGGTGTAVGGSGLIRIETFNISGTLSQNSLPSPASGTPSIVSLSPDEQPTIKIVNIGGQDVPLSPSGSTTSPDVTIPDTATNPLTISIETENVPNGAIIKLRLTLENGDILTADSTPVAASAATASVSISPGTGVVYATATFD